MIERIRDELRLPILYVSHSVAEVARLATTLVMLESGRVLRAGPAREVLSDPGAVPGLGLREAGAVLRARLLGQDADGLTRLDTSAGLLLLPRVDLPVGSELRVRIAAHDVIVARQRPEGLSALNILPATVVEVLLGSGPGAVVQLRAGSDLILARLTRRSAEALALAPGLPVFAVLKSVAVAQSDVSGAVTGPETLLHG